MREAVLPIFVFITGLVAGCVSTHDPILRDEHIVGNIRPGTNTKSDVRLLLGPPHEVSRPVDRISVTDANGVKHVVVESWTYVYRDMRPRLASPGKSIQTGTIIILFDANEVVRDIATRHTGRTS